MEKIFVILAGVLLLSCCVQEKLEWTIKHITDQPKLYNEKNITIEGEYRGWETNCASTGPPVTRNDWQIKDETGCIYVTGIFPELDPYDDIGAKITLNGIIKTNKADIPYIQAITVTVLYENKTQQTEQNKTISDVFTDPGEDLIPPNIPL